MDGIEEKSKVDLRAWFLISLIMLIGLGAITGGILVYRKAINKQKTAAITPTPTLLPSSESTIVLTPTLETSPSPKLKKADLKIEILNGTGMPGMAGKAAQFLENLGYKSIKTGNADNFDYQQTVIQIKDAKKDYAEILVGDLAGKYSVDKEVKSLSDTSTFDAIVIVGKE